MQDNNKYNKRRRSYTEFRTSYSNNKKYFISTDSNTKWSIFLKYLIIVAIMAVLALASFLVTDALLNISEEPYSPPDVTEQAQTPEIDDKHFENMVTLPAE